jgi:peroxiredoxin
MANLNIGNEAKGFKLPGVDGKDHTLAEYREKAAVAVIFSCNHCPYVQAWEDRMVQIQADYADREVQLIAINSNDPQKYPSDSFQSMKKRAAEKSFNFPYLFDETQEIARTYGAQRTPEVFLFDQAGVLRYHGAIDDNYDNPSAVKQHYLRDALEALLAGEEPSVDLTPPVGCTIKWK